MKHAIIVGAAMLGVISSAAMADCPGGVDSPTCVTGQVHRLGANLRCFKVTITPVDPSTATRNVALAYTLLPAGAAEGMEKMLQEGAVLSVITNGGLSSDACGDGTFDLGTGTRAIGY